MWGASGYVMFPGDFGPGEEYWSGSPLNVNDSFLGGAIDAYVVESFEFASGVSRCEVLLSLGTKRKSRGVLLVLAGVESSFDGGRSEVW